ncbi:hypothetical protein SLS63_010645 [Diaporthe eres]|uniref:Uncharacterized protein n=1 Tax=Diaporthe eres TaxID=83184 RepID=A0ABR1NWC3_DIAER
MLASGQRFGANYWVSGKLMAKPDWSASWIAEESLLDTGFQILKAAAYVELLDDNDIAADLIADLMSDWAPSWLFSMENTDKRKSYAWPHTEKEGVSSFRLDEHIWIWRALKSLELNDHQAWAKMYTKAPESQLGLHGNGQMVSGGSPTSNWEDGIKRLCKTFRSQVVHREVLKRFTTENTILRKRMLATTRSIRESRFMLHARDTALLYKGQQIFDFLGEDGSVEEEDTRSARELWKATIQSQTCHAEEQESGWKNALRYALHIMLGIQNFEISNTPPETLVRKATDILISSFSRNGLFSGRTGLLTSKPVEASLIAEEEMDSYYHASFEIPYILLTHSDEVSGAYNRSITEAENSRRRPDTISASEDPLQGLVSHFPQTQLDISPLQGDAKQRQVLLRLSNLLLSRPTIPDLDNPEVFWNVRRTRKKAVPFDNLVDSSNIVKLDDEWLYKYPDFFSTRTTLEIGDSDEGLEELNDVLNPPEVMSGKDALHEYVTDHIRIWNGFFSDRCGQRY